MAETTEPLTSSFNLFVSGKTNETTTMVGCQTSTTSLFCTHNAHFLCSSHTFIGFQWPYQDGLEHSSVICFEHRVYMSQDCCENQVARAPSSRYGDFKLGVSRLGHETCAEFFLEILCSLLHHFAMPCSNCRVMIVLALGDLGPVDQMIGISYREVWR